MKKSPKPVHNIDVERLYVPGFSPTMYAIIAALAPGQIPIADVAASWRYSSFSITSDGFVIATPGRRESGDFLGSVSDFERNIANYIDAAEIESGLTRDDRAAVMQAYHRVVVDWRPAAARGKSFVMRVVGGGQ